MNGGLCGVGQEKELWIRGSWEMSVELKERKVSTTVIDVVGFWLAPASWKLVNKTIEAYELSPAEAQQLNHQRFVLRLVNKDDKGKLRLYELIGKRGNSNNAN